MTPSDKIMRLDFTRSEDTAITFRVTNNLTCNIWVLTVLCLINMLCRASGFIKSISTGMD